MTYSPGVIVGIDMAAAKLAATAVLPGSIGGAEEMPFTAQPKGTFDGPRRVFRLADDMTDWLVKVVGAPYYFIEDTRFTVGRGQALGNANSGEIRGIIYDRLRSGSLPNAGAWLVSPSRWRSFHNCSARGEGPKWAEYYARAEALGFVSECSIKKQREDCTAAFLIAEYGAAVLGLSKRDLTPKQIDMASRIVNDPTVRIA